MRSSRLTRWTLIAGLTACSSNTPPPGSGQEGTYGAGSTGTSGGAGAGGSSFGTGSTSTGVGTSTGAGTTTTATGPSSTTGAGSTSTGAGGSGTGAGGSGQADSGSDRDAAIGGGAGSSGATDASAADSPGIVGVSDAGRGNGGCTNDRVALGSIRLMAGGATPSAFADAYNAELMALTTGGPLLIALSGVDGATTAHRADLGALAESGQQGVTFAGGHAAVPFSTDALGAIRIALTEAPFELKFVPPATSVLLPIAAVALDSALTAGCGALAVTKMKLLVPASAGNIAFHGGTVAALMGAPTEGYGGGTANAWPLELSGTAQRVFAPGAGTDDGGIAP
jgi:hypothetical protein